MAFFSQSSRALQRNAALGRRGAGFHTALPSVRNLLFRPDVFGRQAADAETTLASRFEEETGGKSGLIALLFLSAAGVGALVPIPDPKPPPTCYCQVSSP
jgi:hypothetical protein